MTQDVPKTGSARTDDNSIASDPVGVVDEETQAVDAASEQGGELSVEQIEEPEDASERQPEPEASAGESEEAVDDGEAAPSPAEMIEELRAELAAKDAELVAKAAEVEEQVDKLQRTAAEFQNARRRQERQLSDAINRANVDLIRRLLPIIDDLDLAFQNAPQPASGEAAADSGAMEGDGDIASATGPDGEEAWVSGFRQIQKKLLNLLEEEGVTLIDTSGEFDPLLHEAVLSEESDEVESGHVIGVLRAGYEFKGQVLRPAMVRVAA